MNITTINDAQKAVDQTIVGFGGYWPPLSMLASVMEEVGELSREINALEKFKPKKKTESKATIDEEISDIFFSLICIANHYKVDMGLGLEKVIEKYRERDNNRF